MGLVTLYIYHGAPGAGGVIPLSKPDSQPGAQEHAEIQRLKEESISIIMDAPAAFLFVHSIERFI